MSAEVPVVSVLVPTYQHAAYIEQCLESILMQQTSFPVEILVGEDESTDGTREICQRYAAQYPDRIQLLLGSRKDVMYINGRATGRFNLMQLFSAARGSYFALCDGDDYWTDPMKLQRQVEALEMNPDHAMCFHRAQMLRSGQLEQLPIPREIDLNDVRLDDLLGIYNFVTTASVMYRRSIYPFPDWFSKVPFADLALHALAAAQGKIICLEQSMSVWRFTGTGVWTKLGTLAQEHSTLKFYTIISPHLTDTQRAVVVKKRSILLEKIAHSRYPVHPRRKKFYLAYLQIRFRS